MSVYSWPTIKKYIYTEQHQYEDHECLLNLLSPTLKVIKLLPCQSNELFDSSFLFDIIRFHNCAPEMNWIPIGSNDVL